MELLDIENILIFHKKIVSKTGGSEGVRDLGLIESALSRGLMTFDGRDLYESIEMKISVIAHSLISNHGFIDGNKRIGVAILILLLKLNDIEIRYTQQEIIDIGLGVAEGKINENDILEWIKTHK
jgi:death on curing protein